MRLSGRPYERLKKQLRTQSEHAGRGCEMPRCICPHGRAIDYRLRYPNKWAFTLDHIIPRHKGGPMLDPANCRPAHHGCNSSKGAIEGNQQRRPLHTSTRW